MEQAQIDITPAVAIQRIQSRLERIDGAAYGINGVAKALIKDGIEQASVDGYKPLPQTILGGLHVGVETHAHSIIDEIEKLKDDLKFVASALGVKGRHAA